MALDTTTDRSAGPENSTGSQAAWDGALLLARVGLGVLMLWHVKVVYDFSGGVSGYVDGFDQIGVPLPAVSAPLNMLSELLAGLALILGVAVRLAGIAVAANMVGAWVFVHTTGLYSMTGNGPETVMAIGLLALVLAVAGPGRLSVLQALPVGSRRFLR